MGRIDETEYQTLRRFLRDVNGESDMAALLHRALEQELTARQRMVMQMYFVQQHSMREIAQLLDVNPSTVSRTIAAGREKLRRCLRYGSKRLLQEALDRE